jgi:hypothetical protein
MTISPNKWELDVQGYLNVCNITSATPRQQIRDFAKGVNDLGLWNSMVCWPLRSSQNYGSGDTVFSLGGRGTFNGTRVGGPTWGANGITITSSATITDAGGAPTFPTSIVIAGRRVSGSGDTQWEYISSGTSRSFARRIYANNSMSLGISGVGLILMVDTNAQTFNNNFEVSTGIVPSATNSQAEIFINATKPAQTAFEQPWGTGASTLGTLQIVGDGQFEASMHAVFTTAINAPAFYQLYKDTLGQGLTGL